MGFKISSREPRYRHALIHWVLLVVKLAATKTLWRNVSQVAKWSQVPSSGISMRPREIQVCLTNNRPHILLADNPAFRKTDFSSLSYSLSFIRIPEGKPLRSEIAKSAFHALGGSHLSIVVVVSPTRKAHQQYDPESPYFITPRRRLFL